jgi:hypothetical protein
MRRTAFALATCLALLAPGCTTVHELGIPNAQFDGITFTQLEADVASQEATLDVALRFLVDNPTGTRLVIPRHGYSVLLKRRDQPDFAMTRIYTDTKDPRIVPAGGQAVLEYPMTLSLSPATANQALAYLGWEAVYELRAIVDLGPLNPPSGPPTLKHRGRLKLPLPPRIVVDGVPTFQFVGDLEHLDLSGIKHLMQPAVDVINGIGASNIPGLGPAWDEFVDGFNRLQGRIDYPGPDTEGLKIAVPVRVINQNHFDIELPSFASMVRIAGTANPVLDLRLTPGNGTALNRAQRRIDPLAFKRLKAESTVRWKDLGDGLSQLLGPNGFGNVQLSGSVSVDLGYGPVKITYP